MYLRLAFNKAKKYTSQNMTTETQTTSLQTISDLEAQLSQYLSNNVFTLLPASLNSTAIESLIETFIAGHQLMLQNASLSSSEAAITISGNFSPFDGLDLNVAASFSYEDGQIALKLDSQTAPGQTLGLKLLIQHYLPGVTLPDGLPDLGLTGLSLSSSPLSASFTFGSGAGSWVIPVGIGGLSVGDVKLTLTRVKGENNEGNQLEAKINGSLELAGAAFELEYTPPGDLVINGHTPSIELSALLGELCGGSTLAGLSLPGGFADITLPEVTIVLDVKNERLSLSTSTSIFDAIGLTIGKDDKGKWGFSAGLVPVASWKLSSISSALSGLDSLSFDETALVLSSADGLPLPALLTGRNDLEVIQGLNFFSTLSLDGLGADKLLGIEHIDVHAAIGASLESFVLEAGIGGHVKLADNATLRNIEFRLHPAPSAFEVTLLGGVDVTIESSNLSFIGGVSVTPTGASFAATLKGDWIEPFGAKGVSINGLAIELGIAFDDLLPIIGLAGGMTIGSVHGKAAVRFDSGNPSLALIAVQFDSLNLGDVLNTLCSTAIPGLVPAGSVQTILNVTFKEAEFHIVPQTTHIGELVYQQGLGIAARVNFWGYEADGSVQIDYDTGITVDATLDPIVIQDIFQLSGAGGQGGPAMHLDLTTAKTPGLNISGEIALLGLSAQTEVSLSDSGFYFLADGKIYDLFQAHIEARGGHFENTEAFMLKASLTNDLFAFLREEIGKALEEASQSATQSIAASQQDVANAQAKVDGLNQQVDAMRKTVQAERDQAQQKVKDAQQSVNAAQAKVDSFNSQISALRQTIQAERDQAQQKVQSAQQSVASAQQKVNDLNSQIAAMHNTVQAERDQAQQKVRSAQQQVNNAQASVDSLNQQLANTRAIIMTERANAQRQIDQAQQQVNNAQNSVNSLQDQINSLNNWYYSLPKVDWPWKDSQTSRAADYGIRIAGLYTALGTATGALQAAQGVLDAAKRAANLTPIDADPRMVALYTALGTATAALRTAQAVLAAAQGAIVVTPVDSDPRIVGLIAARDAATVALQAAQGVLATAQAGIVTFPIEADPRMVSLIAARDAATLALKTAQAILSAAQAAIATFPIDADPRVAGLLGALQIATAALQATNSALDGVKAGVAGTLAATEYVANYGLGGLVDIRAASFEASLDVAKGGSVYMSADLSYMGNPQHVEFSFNFNDPISSAKALAHKLFGN